jgi:hypothetical protein
MPSGSFATRPSIEKFQVNRFTFLDLPLLVTYLYVPVKTELSGDSCSYFGSLPVQAITNSMTRAVIAVTATISAPTLFKSAPT